MRKSKKIEEKKGIDWRMWLFVDVPEWFRNKFIKQHGGVVLMHKVKSISKEMIELLKENKKYQPQMGGW